MSPNGQIRLRNLYMVQNKVIFYLVDTIKYYKYMVMRYSVVSDYEKQMIETSTKLSNITNIIELFPNGTILGDNCEFYYNAIKELAKAIKIYTKSVDYLKQFNLRPLDASDVKNVANMRAILVGRMNDVITIKIKCLVPDKFGHDFNEIFDDAFERLDDIINSLEAGPDVLECGKLYEEAIAISNNIEIIVRSHIAKTLNSLK